MHRFKFSERICLKGREVGERKTHAQERLQRSPHLTILLHGAKLRNWWKRRWTWDAGERKLGIVFCGLFFKLCRIILHCWFGGKNWLVECRLDDNGKLSKYAMIGFFVCVCACFFSSYRIEWRHVYLFLLLCSFNRGRKCLHLGYQFFLQLRQRMLCSLSISC